eukprot:COSAG01_NODE_12962_length_1656_cov_2.761079_3_plen_90_part_00
MLAFSASGGSGGDHLAAKGARGVDDEEVEEAAHPVLHEIEAMTKHYIEIKTGPIRRRLRLLLTLCLCRSAHRFCICKISALNISRCRWW